MRVSEKFYFLVYFVYKGTISLCLGSNHGDKEIKQIKKSIF
jgi:hypothetical protein